MEMLYTIAETTYTPQGDGNIDDPILRDGQQLKQLTPRKGTVIVLIFKGSSFTAQKRHHPARGR